LTDTCVLLAQVLNWVTLGIILLGLVVVPVAVGRDARRSGLSWKRTGAWVLASLVLLPIGAGLYLLLGCRREWPGGGEGEG
jgi:hypothetical protein